MTVIDYPEQLVLRNGAVIIGNADRDVSEEILEEARQHFFYIFNRETEILEAGNCGGEFFDYFKTVSGSTALYGAMDDYVKARPHLEGGRYDF